MPNSQRGIIHILVIIAIAAAIGTMSLIIYNFSRQQILKSNAKGETPIQNDVTAVPIPSIEPVNTLTNDNLTSPPAPTYQPDSNQSSTYQPASTNQLSDSTLPSDIYSYNNDFSTQPLATTTPTTQSTRNSDSTSRLVTRSTNTTTQSYEILNPDTNENSSGQTPAKTPTPLSVLVKSKEKTTTPYYIYSNPDSNHLKVTVPYSTLNKGCVYTGNVYAQVNDMPNGGADAVLRFDPNILQIHTVDPIGAAYDSQKIETSYFFTGDPTKEYKILTFTFSVKTQSTATSGKFFFDFDPNDLTKTTDSNIVNFQTLDDIDYLQEVYNASFTIASGACSS